MLYITWYYDNSVRVIYCCDFKMNNDLQFYQIQPGRRSYMAPTLVVCVGAVVCD